MAKSNTITNIDYLKPIPEVPMVSVVLTSDPVSPIGSADAEITVTFREPVTGFLLNKVNLDGDPTSLGSFSGSGKVYTFVVTPNSRPASLTIIVPENSAINRVGYGNSAAELELSFTS
jgi:hypothetical protein